MPDQKFTDPATGDEVASIHWDLGMSSVDVAFGGSLLTKITDVAPLRTTGMGGMAPDGSAVVIRLGFGDTFEVTRNGEQLTAGAVDMFANIFTTGSLVNSAATTPRVSMDNAGRLMHGTTVLDDGSRPPVGAGTSFGPKAVSALIKARKWLMFFGICNTFIFLIVGMVAVAGIIGIGLISEDELPSFLVAVGAALLIGLALIPLALCIAAFKLRSMANSRRARRAMQVSKWISLTALGLTGLDLIVSIPQLVQRPFGLFGFALRFWMFWSAFQAFSEAELLSPYE